MCKKVQWKPIGVCPGDLFCLSIHRTQGLDHNLSHI